jgi:hypothetical protein
MKPATRLLTPALALLILDAALMSESLCAEFQRIVIDPNFPGAYQVEVADVNGDHRPDIIALGGASCAWYENPTWKKRIVTGPGQTPGVISSATADLDGDGKAEIAIAYEFEMNKPRQGKLLLAKQGSGVDEPWTLTQIAEIPSIHRLRWGDVKGNHRLDLIIAPLFGADSTSPGYQQGQATIRRWNRQNPQASTRPPVLEELSSHYVLHAIDLVDVDKDGKLDILTADNEGAHLITFYSQPSATRDQPEWTRTALIAGFPGTAPKRGCSEIHLGHKRDGSRFLATVEPWHGSDVAIWPEQGKVGSLHFGPRQVIDNTLADGHALWIADIDNDGDDEVIAGHRGKDHRVSVYDLDQSHNRWSRTILDHDIAAQDLRGGDLDGDGVPDVVAVGGATHNVVWYRFAARK